MLYHIPFEIQYYINDNNEIYMDLTYIFLNVTKKKKKSSPTTVISKSEN